MLEWEKTKKSKYFPENAIESEIWWTFQFGAKDQM